MQIQVNSDKTVVVDDRLTRFVKQETRRSLSRFGEMVTRVEVHLSDVNSKKAGPADKRCMVEARPASARPRIATAAAEQVDDAVRAALSKMQRSLTTFFGRLGRAAHVPAEPVKKAAAKKATKKVAKKAASEQAATEAELRGPKKKRIYQARRKNWPAR